MNPELKAKWVAALRSGDYRQVRGGLHGKDNTHCCLGVLNILNNGPIEGQNPSDKHVSFSDVLTQDQWTKLVQLNDAPDSSFTQIADYIEANL